MDPHPSLYPTPESTPGTSSIFSRDGRSPATPFSPVSRLRGYSSLSDVREADEEYFPLSIPRKEFASKADKDNKNIDGEKIISPEDVFSGSNHLHDIAC
jgi:hypothetical protein